MCGGHVDEQEGARVDDHARLWPVGLDADAARHHRVGGEALAQHCDMVEPVEQRQHELWLGRNSPQRRRHPGGLGGHDQHVHRLLQPINGARMSSELAEGHAAHAQPARDDRRSGRLSGHDDDVGARAVEHGREQPAHPAGAEDCDVHESGSMSTPGFMMPAGSTAAFAPRRACANGSGRCTSYHGR